MVWLAGNRFAVIEEESVGGFILNRGPNEEENRQRAKWKLLLRSWPVHSHFDRRLLLLLRVSVTSMGLLDLYWEIGQSAAAEIE